MFYEIGLQPSELQILIPRHLIDWVGLLLQHVNMQRVCHIGQSWPLPSENTFKSDKGISLRLLRLP